jgi:hypothetical protein
MFLVRGVSLEKAALRLFLTGWQNSSNYGSTRQTYAKIGHGLGLHLPQNSNFQNGNESHALPPIVREVAG